MPRPLDSNTLGILIVDIFIPTGALIIESCILTDLEYFPVNSSLKEVHRGIKGMLWQLLLIRVLHLTFAMLGRNLTHKDRSALFRQHTPHSLDR
jgi:hypothetical protein